MQTALRSKGRQKGYIFILNAMVVSGLVAGAILFSTTAVMKKGEDLKTEAQSEYVIALRNALDAYIADNQSILADQIRTGDVCDLVAGIPNNAPMAAWKLNVPRIGSAALPVQPGSVGVTPACSGSATAPVSATLTADNLAVLPLSQLIDAQYLPSAFSSTDIHGGDYRIFLHRVIDPTDTNTRHINGLIIRRNLIEAGTAAENFTEVGRLIDLIGPEYAGSLVGTAPNLRANGPFAVRNGVREATWGTQLSALGFTPASITALNLREGLLAVRAGTWSSYWTAELRLDGTTPMRGDLNLAGREIENVSTLEIIETAEEGQLCSADDEGTLRRVRTASGGLTSLLECTQGEWKNPLGIRGGAVFDQPLTWINQLGLRDLWLNTAATHFLTVRGANAYYPFIVPPAVTRINLKLIGGGGAGGSGGPSYFIPGMGVTNMGPYLPSRIGTKLTPPPDLGTSHRTGRLDSVVVDGATGAMSNEVHDPIYTDLYEFLPHEGVDAPWNGQISNYGVRAGGGGGGGGSEFQASLNVLPGDELRIHVGAGGLPFTSCIWDSPHNGDADAPYYSNAAALAQVRALGKPSYVEHWRNGSLIVGMVANGGLHGGVSGAQLHRLGWAPEGPNIWVVGSSGRSAAPCIYNASSTSCTSNTFASIWSADFGEIAGINSTKRGQPGRQGVGIVPLSNLSELTTRGGDGGGSSGGLGSSTAGVGYSAPANAYGSGGGGGWGGPLDRSFYEDRTCHPGGAGSGGAVFLEW